MNFDHYYKADFFLHRISVIIFGETIRFRHFILQHSKIINLFTTKIWSLQEHHNLQGSSIQNKKCYSNIKKIQRERKQSFLSPFKFLYIYTLCVVYILTSVSDTHSPALFLLTQMRTDGAKTPMRRDDTLMNIIQNKIQKIGKESKAVTPMLPPITIDIKELHVAYCL